MNTHPLRGRAVTAAVLLAATLALTAADLKNGKEKPKTRPYTLKICIVSGLDLDDAALVFTYEDREIKVCCDMCIDDFYKDPLHFVDKIEEAEKGKKSK